MPMILQRGAKSALTTAYTAPTLETALAVISQNSELSLALRHAASLRTTTSITRPRPV